MGSFLLHAVILVLIFFAALVTFLSFPEVVVSKFPDLSRMG